MTASGLLLEMRLRERLKRRYWALARAEKVISARVLAEGVRRPPGFTDADALEVAGQVMLELYRREEKRCLRRFMR